MLFLPHVDSACFQRFLEELRRDTGTERLGVVLHNSGSHTSGQVNWREGVAKIPLPPYYSPELNPAERWFEALRRVFANCIFESLDEFQETLAASLEPYWKVPATLQRLVGRLSLVAHRQAHRATALTRKKEVPMCGRPAAPPRCSRGCEPNLPNFIKNLPDSLGENYQSLRYNFEIFTNLEVFCI